MSNQTFTPGNWFPNFGPGKLTVKPESQRHVSGTPICTVDLHRQEARDNARLIAAAPELLEALIAVVAIADRKTDEFDRARAAIAKATNLK